MYDLLEKCREKLNSTFSYIISIFGGGLKKRVIYHIRLNYGYAVVRSAIARAIVTVGCHPAFGIHHNNQLNAFNLVDDLIEPFRALVDLVAHENIGTNEWLTKAERSSLAHVLHNVCLVNGTKVSVLYAIELMSESYKRILMHESEEELVLPTVISIESMEGITE